jgi:mono/diheme cytochrome c family protein
MRIAWLGLVLAAAGVPAAREPIHYARDIQPIFAARCYTCHGLTLQSGGLRLDRRAGALKGGDSGVPAILPGRAAASLLIQYVLGKDSKTVMPPAGDRLTPAQIKLLSDWIDRGAEWPEDSAAIDYAREIRPIFEGRCYQCHGSSVQTHGLRLDRKESALKGGDSGAPAIVPGRSADSLLIRYVAGLDPRVVMPAKGERLTPAQIDLLRRWIDGGAEWPETAPAESASTKHRDHWAFQPVRKPPVPRARNQAWVRNPIDAFVLQKLDEHGWKPSPAAKAGDLLRRLYLDLTGLPPTPDEQQAFLRDPSPQSVDRLVDDLLARPAYGERWARHWLDLVRYAETNGYERDAMKPQVWKYRDYVIRAFNSDKPFDQFTVEQLAGDELPETSEESLVATGYYRLGPWDDEPADPAEDRYDQLEDLVHTTSQVFLGLTLSCARCHNHKFEPLSARDYYSMVAIFNGFERPRNDRTELDLPAGTREQLAAETERDLKIAPLALQIATWKRNFRFDFLQSGASRLPVDVIRALLLDPKRRNDADRKLIEENTKKFDEEVERAMPDGLREKLTSAEQQVAELRKLTPDLPRGYFLREPKPDPPATHLLIRGKAALPGPVLEPAVPAVLVTAQPAFPNGRETSLRRLTLAKWIVNPANPLTARVIVNRVWQFHFGEGLVRTPSDFGVMGEKPTHPELLDWLAAWFVENGWSIKKLHRLILSSNTYRMSKDWNAAYGAADPESRLLWRVPYTRLQVEAILDSMLAVSGRLNPKMYGPSMYPFVPAAALAGHSDPDKVWKPFDEPEASRRAIYAHVKRSMVVPLLEVLDFCDTSRTTAKRLNTSVASQALSLFNGDFVNRQARHLAERLVRDVGTDRAHQVERAYQLALCRPPTATERAAMLEFLEHELLDEMCRVIFNLDEFVYAN